MRLFTFYNSCTFYKRVLGSLSLLCAGFALAGCHTPPGGASTPSNGTMGAALQPEPTAGAQDWKEYVSEYGRFKVLIPGTPKITRPDAARKLGDTQMIVHSLETPSYKFTVSHSDYLEDNLRPEDANKLVDNALDMISKAGNKTERKRVVIAPASLHVSGKEFLVQLPESKAPKGSALKGRMFLYKRRFYQVQALVIAGKGKMADANKFLDSFALLK